MQNLTVNEALLWFNAITQCLAVTQKGPDSVLDQQYNNSYHKDTY